MTRPHRRFAALSAVFAVLFASLTLTSPMSARADDYCAYEDPNPPIVTNFGPSTVTLGLKRKPVEFWVQAQDECGISGWSIDTQDRFLFFVYKQSPKDTLVPFRNRDAGQTAVDVRVQDQAYNVSTRRLTFQLLRQTRWQKVSAGPESVRNGGRVRIKGTLQRADWDQDRFVRFGESTEKATVQFKAKGSAVWSTVKAVDFRATGRISTPVTVKGQVARDGWYRLHFAGRFTSSASVSAPQYVNVR